MRSICSAAGPDHDNARWIAEGVVAKGSIRVLEVSYSRSAITLQLRLGLDSFGAGGRNRTRNPLLTRQSLTRIELRRRWYPAQESNPETAGFADPPEIRLARCV